MTLLTETPKVPSKYLAVKHWLNHFERDHQVQAPFVKLAQAPRASLLTVGTYRLDQEVGNEIFEVLLKCVAEAVFGAQDEDWSFVTMDVIADLEEQRRGVMGMGFTAQELEAGNYKPLAYSLEEVNRLLELVTEKNNELVAKAEAEGRTVYPSMAAYLEATGLQANYAFRPATEFETTRAMLRRLRKLTGEEVREDGALVLHTRARDPEQKVSVLENYVFNPRGTLIAVDYAVAVE